MCRMHSLQRSTSKQLAHLQAKLAQATQVVGVDMDEAMHENLMTTVQEQSSYIEVNHPRGTF